MSDLTARAGRVCGDSYFFIPFIGVGFICLFWTGMFVFRAYLRKAETRRATVRPPP